MNHRKYVHTYGDSLSFAGETGLYRDQLNGGFKFNLSELVSTNKRNEVNRKLRNNTHSVWSPLTNNEGLNFSYSHESDLDQIHVNKKNLNLRY